MGRDLDPSAIPAEWLTYARLQSLTATLEQHPTVMTEKLLLQHSQFAVHDGLQQQLLGSEHQLQQLAQVATMGLGARYHSQRCLDAVAIHHLGSQIVDPAQKLGHEAVLRAAIKLLRLSHLL